MTWLAFYTGLSLVSAGVLWPMLRMPRVRMDWAAPVTTFAAVPNSTYDSRGMV